MASAGRRESGGLIERLFKEPYRFDFFQAVRILEQWAQPSVPLGKGARRRSSLIGQDLAPEQEAVRFRAQPSLSFPANAIHRCRPMDKPEGGTVPHAEMTVTFMGLTGPIGVLPHHYTSLLLQRIKLRDYTLRDFLDLFHHRAISLFYRAWVKYRLPFAYERAKREDPDREDLITWALYCLVGLGTGGLRGRLAINDEAFLYYGGHFAHYPRSAIVLESILADYFALPIRLLQAQGQWLRLDPAEQAAMPGAVSKGRNNLLGLNFVVGDRIWDVQSKFRIRIGPLSYADFRRFLPNGDALKPLCQLIRRYAGPEFDFDIQLVLRAAEVPKSQVGGGKSRLGWNTWSGTGSFVHAVEDAVFSVAGI